MDATYPSLSGRVVLVTGGAQGIGAAIVRGFVASGARVGFFDIAAEAGEALAEETGARFFSVDLTDVAAIEAGVRALSAKLGPVSVLVNNAAWDQRHPIGDVTVELWDRIQAVNLRHTFFVTQACLPGLRETRGSIVNLSSTSYVLGVPGMSGYVAAKAGIVGMTRSLARELADDGIRVNAVLPGWVMTERQKALWVTEEAMAETIARQSVKRELLPEDMPPMVLFLAADDSRAISGQAFHVDGGIT